jgi:hypothetical protein
MSKAVTTFMDELVAGHATADDIYDYVEEWHSTGGKIPMPEFLGMTVEEYTRWAIEPAELAAIVAARRARSRIAVR